MTELSTGIMLLNDGRILDTVNKKVLTYQKDMTWLLSEESVSSGDGVMRKADRIDQMQNDIKYLLPVYCAKIYKRGKTTYAEMMDRTHSFEYPINGKRLIDNKWVDFNFRMYPSSAYLLIAMKQAGWPHELYIFKHKKIENGA